MEGPFWTVADRFERSPTGVRNPRKCGNLGDFTWFHVISRDFTWFHVISRAFTWFHVISRDFTWFHVWYWAHFSPKIVAPPSRSPNVDQHLSGLSKCWSQTLQMLNKCLMLISSFSSPIVWSTCSTLSTTLTTEGPPSRPTTPQAMLAYLHDMRCIARPRLGLAVSIHKGLPLRHSSFDLNIGLYRIKSFVFFRRTELRRDPTKLRSLQAVG